MKAEFINKLLCQPWNISRSQGRTIIGSMISRLIENERPPVSDFGDPLPTMQIMGDVAIIPVKGRLMLNVPDWIKAWGMNITDIDDIAEELDAALNNPNVRMIVLDNDTPGGESFAGDKYFDLVEAANRRKPVMAFCGDGALMCSSGYEGAAAARAVYVGKYSCSGCIGSYMCGLDDTEYWKQQGMKWFVLRSGDLKGIGEDKITPDQIKYLQSLVDKAGDTFRKNVMKYRTAISPVDMEGQWFNGVEAAQKGFAAAVAKDLDAAIAKFRAII